MVKNTKTKKVKDSICAPGVKGKTRKSCFKDDDIDVLIKMWNERHPDDKINETYFENKLSKLKKSFNGVCSSDKCMVRYLLKNNSPYRKTLLQKFAPDAPKSWSTNLGQWLTTTDISKIMAQYERAFPDFAFYGPMPVDFEYKMDNGQCVWPEMCSFDITKLLASGKRSIGFIFNLDDHTKDGSHWVSAYVDFNKKEVYYIDSVGSEPPTYISNFIKKIIKQADKCGFNLIFKIAKNQHQELNTECGIYSIYFLVSLLTGEKTFDELEKKRIPDSKMSSLRFKYFNFH